MAPPRLPCLPVGDMVTHQRNRDRNAGMTRGGSSVQRGSSSSPGASFLRLQPDSLSLCKIAPHKDLVKLFVKHIGDPVQQDVYWEEGDLGV